MKAELESINLELGRYVSILLMCVFWLKDKYFTIS